MSEPKPTRRKLDFADFPAMLADVDQLRLGYRKAGNWDLAQVCGHLAEWLTFPVKGFPIKPFPWLVRVTVGKFLVWQVLRSRSFPANGWTVKETIPPPSGDESAAVERLRQAVAVFESHDGNYLPSPLFGQMPREGWQRFHLIHTAHHLSFLVPDPNLASGGA